MTFPLWFSGAEQVLRYHGVRDNLFAIEPDVPLPSGASYDAYLMENVLPGRAGGVPMRTGRLLAREGVVSALFYRLATSRPLQQRYQDEAFYRAFGTTRAAVDPLDNVYLKMFSAIRGGGYDAAAVVSEWKRRFPADAAEVDTVLRSVFHGQPVPDAPALWVENAAFHTGTSLFDQFRALPQAYAFDLNACSRIDLLTIPGMTRTAAAAIVEGAPYVSLDDLARRAALPPGVADTIRSYAARADRRLAQDEETALSLSLRSVLKPYAWRALEVLAAAAFVAAWLHRKARRIGWIRAGLNGIAGALCGLVAAWSVDSGSGLLTLAVPVLVFGVPAALWRAARSRSLREAGRVLATWTLSAIVPVLLTAPF
jgi:DNA uptake protein ComE-like DNA-binding protein